MAALAHPVARRIVDWFGDGIGTYMLASKTFEAELECSAAVIMPRVDALTEERLASWR
ncbi:hypothetical protein ACWDUN_14525 [Mycobacterium sp. NPDC003323]